jgi:hypothetical protein
MECVTELKQARFGFNSKAAVVEDNNYKSVEKACSKY